uniref:60S ribosomal protein L35 n=1 Tax=Romanomermis culicivorax TaxID=13658 RepID=A0A915IKP7_ROMCU
MVRVLLKCLKKAVQSLPVARRALKTRAQLSRYLKKEKKDKAIAKDSKQKQVSCKKFPEKQCALLRARVY